MSKSVILYCVSSILLEYIWKMINGSHRWTKRLHRKICDDCFKEKKFIYKIYKLFLLMHSLFECYILISYFWGRKKFIYWNMIVKKKVWNFISLICFMIISWSYSEIKDFIQAIFGFFGLSTATSFDFLR